MDLLTALLAAGVATGYFAIAVLIVPRIQLVDATPTFVRVFRLGGIAFFVGCGLTHTHIAVHAVADDASVGSHEAAFHFLQVFGVWAFIVAAVRFLDVRVSRRRTPEEAEAETLRERVDRLSRSNQDLDQFAHVVAHDLKAPLQSVRGFAGLLERRYGSELSPPGDDWLHRINDGTRRMNELLDGVLEYSRAASQGLNRRATDLDEVMRDVLGGLDHMLEDYGPRVTWESSPPIVADPVQLRQLLQNLVGNAIKFGARDAPEVHVAARVEAGWATITVADNGRGIDRADAERIFAMFDRGSAGDDRPGTGVGLAVCAKIAERHGGHIRADPRPGGGTCVSVALAQPVSAPGARNGGAGPGADAQPRARTTA